MNIPYIVIGSVLLILGRKLFWLFVACLGFAAGFIYTEQLMGPQPEYIVVGVAIIIGVLGGILAIFLQGLAIGVSGFMAGAYITLIILELAGFQETQFMWALCVIGGIVGTALLVFLFDYALILISSMAGASLIIQAGIIEPKFHLIAFLVMILLGGAIQAKIMDVEPGSEDRKRRQYY